MKVLKNNYVGVTISTEDIKPYPFPRKLTCENCHSELEYEKSDIGFEAYGCGYIECPFEEIKEYIQKGINYFRNNKDEFSWFTETGTLHVAVWRMDGDESYEVVVSKDHYATSIPFEEVDYNPDWKDEY